LVVRGHQIKEFSAFQAYLWPHEGFWRIGLSPILQKQHPLLAAFASRTSHVLRDEWAVKKGFEHVEYFGLSEITVLAEKERFVHNSQQSSN
jgi:hypothetical protein